MRYKIKFDQLIKNQNLNAQFEATIVYLMVANYCFIH